MLESINLFFLFSTYFRQCYLIEFVYGILILQD